MAKRKEWIFDWKQSLAQNFFWLIMVLFIYVFAFFGISAAASIEEEMLKVMALVFTLFFTLKMVAWNGHPRIVLMEKK
jgi:uncharacterized membrane protein YfcA